MDLQAAYFERCERESFVVDEHQLAAVRAIEQFWSSGAKGLYIWGNVGRGKTFLMDLFYDRAEGIKRRVHFHALAREVREGLARLSGANPMERLALEIAPPGSLLCIDELHVADLDNGMVLELFLKELVRNRLVVVTTSNFAPETLFPTETGGAFGGQQLLAQSRRETLRLLDAHFEVLGVEGSLDYRRTAEQDAGRFFVGDATETVLALVSGASSGDVLPVRFDVFGRPVSSLWRSTEACVFEFESICRGLYSFRDYLEMFDGVAHLGVVDVDIDSLDSARRFTWLIEIAYDQRVQITVSSSRDPVALFQRLPPVPDHLALEHERVVSRVIELTST